LYTNPVGADDPTLWVLNERNKSRYEQSFNSANPVDGKLTGAGAKTILVSTGLSFFFFFLFFSLFSFSFFFLEKNIDNFNYNKKGMIS